MSQIEESGLTCFILVTFTPTQICLLTKRSKSINIQYFILAPFFFFQYEEARRSNDNKKQIPFGEHS